MRIFTFLLLMGGLLSLQVQAQRCSPSRSSCNCNRANDLLYTELGGGANYWVARTDQAPEDFSQENLGGQLSGMVGLRVDRRDRRRANVLGVWGSIGLPSETGLNRQLSLLGLNESTTADPVENQFREIEGGFLLRERLRISAGKGQQFLTQVDGTETILDYYTGTAGLNLRLGRSLSWNSAATIALGGDYEAPIWRLSTGLAFWFNWFDV
ncbi:MAG: hypothetical protein AAF804_17745 [Bacteroidota bacterium]